MPHPCHEDPTDERGQLKCSLQCDTCPQNGYERHRDAKRYIARHWREHMDGRTGEVDHTSLAEAAAQRVGHDEWLDDPDHPIWDWAVDLVPSANRVRCP